MRIGPIELALMERFPRKDIRGMDGSLYLRRYRIAGYQGRIPFPFGCSLYIHRIERPDEDRDPHDHPWAFFLSLILQGGYVEERWGRDASRPREATQPEDVHFRMFPGLAFRRGTDLHRIGWLMNGGPCWTLVLTGPRGRRWGFWTGKGWIDHERYIGDVGLPAKAVAGSR